MWVGLLLLLLLFLLLLLLLLQLLLLLSLVRFIIFHNNILALLVLWFSVLRNYRRLVMTLLGAELASAEAFLHRDRGIFHVDVLLALFSGVSLKRSEDDRTRGSCQQRACFPRFGTLWGGVCPRDPFLRRISLELLFLSKCLPHQPSPVCIMNLHEGVSK